MRGNPRRRGSVLYLALLTVISLAGLSLAMVQVGASFSRETVARLDDERALYLAEAAVAEAVFAIQNGGTGTVGSAANPARFGRGMFWSDSVAIDGNRRVVTIAAAQGKGRAAIEVIVTPQAHPAQQYALFSDKPITVEPSSVIDSFDSALGTYASQLAVSVTGYVNDQAVVSSNSGIHVEMPSEIWGDATPGPAQLATSDDPSAISGSTAPNDTTLHFDTVTVPTIPSSGTMSAWRGADVYVHPGDYNFTKMTVGVGSRMIVQGPARIVVDDWIIRSNAEFVFDSTSGPIELYVSGTVDLASNSTITTPSKSALDTSVYLVGGPTQSVVFDSNSEFYGTIYGPEATVEVDSNFEVFGSIAADEIVLAANTRVHFDEQLLGGSAGQLLTFGIQSWRRVDFPDRVLRVDRRDPFQVTGFDPNLLQSPADLNGI